MSRDALGRVDGFIGLVLPGLGDSQQHFTEGGHIETTHRWEVGARIKRAQVWRQEDRHGPAAGTGHGLGGGHVDVVQVGAFLAVHLDVDEALVHQCCGFRILEGLVRHDVTPMAGGVANAQEDRFVFGLRFSQGFFTPGVPVYRVVGVLEKIGGCGC